MDKVWPERTDESLCRSAFVEDFFGLGEEGDFGFGGGRLEIGLHGTGIATIERIEEREEYDRLSAFASEPAFHPCFYFVRQALRMVNGNNDQAGAGGIVGGNRAQLRH